MGVPLGVFLRGEDGDTEQELTESSYIVDCIFKDNSGTVSSAVSVYESRVNFLSIEGGSARQFDGNVASEGATIYSVRSTLLFRNITFYRNTGVRGGCVQIVTSELDAYQSTFEQNDAELGGAIFAIQEAVLQIRASELRDNRAGEGSLVYSMANKIIPGVGRKTEFIKLQTAEDGNQPSLVFIDSRMMKNWAKQDTIHILRSSFLARNCTFQDNYAHEVTHGFTMVASEVYLDSTDIRNTYLMVYKLGVL